MMFGGPKVNNVLASMTDKIVCATFSADPNAVEEDDEREEEEEEEEEEEDEEEEEEEENGAEEEQIDLASPEITAPMSSLALAAAPLLTSNFTFDTHGLSVLNNYSAPNSRRSSQQQEETTANSKLSLVGDYANSGALTSVPHIFSIENAGEGYPLSPQVRHKLSTSSVSLSENVSEKRPIDGRDADDASVCSAQVTPKSTPGRSPINTDDRDNFTEEVTV